MTLLVRQAQRADIVQICALDSRINPSPMSEQRFCRALETDSPSDHELLVAVRTEKVEGYLLSSRVLDQGSIEVVGVSESCRRRGVGLLLVKRALQRLYKAGAQRCFLEVRASNTAAQALYGALGFQSDGVRPNYYPSAQGREDAQLMSIALQGSAYESA